ncbi:hypothetical protein LINGRAHAP2_LOCUS5616 [Linum grandiflorum]
MSDEETNVSWVGGIYRKFEALCVEADDIIRQEAHGFIENHLQPAGSNVKQFYSELVREMVSQSSPDGSTEEAQPDLVLKETTDSFTNVSFEVADEKKQIDLDESERSDEVQSPVPAELGNSAEEEPLNVEHVQDNQSPCEQITAGNSNPSSVSGNAAKLDESCILVNDDDEEYVLALRERRRWCYKVRIVILEKMEHY